METRLLRWTIYEVTSEKISLNGVKLRGRIRKFGISNNINVLVENTEDINNGVRFAVLSTDDAKLVGEFLETILIDVSIKLLIENLQNPVLSKIKVNDESRYDIQ